MSDSPIQPPKSDTTTENISTKRDWDSKQLIEMFMHLDKTLTEKEKLLYPLSLLILPAVVASWEKIPNGYVLIAAAAVSILLHWYHNKVCLRFVALQNRLFDEIYELQGGKEEGSQFYRIIHGSQHSPKNSSRQTIA